MTEDLPNPEPDLSLTDLDWDRLKALEVGEKLTTENGTFSVLRYKDCYIVSYGSTQLTLPGLFSISGYLSH